MYVYMRVCLCMRACVRVCVCVCMCMRACVCACVRIYTCIYIYIYVSDTGPDMFVLGRLDALFQIFLLGFDVVAQHYTHLSVLLLRANFVPLERLLPHVDFSPKLPPAYTHTYIQTHMSAHRELHNLRTDHHTSTRHLQTYRQCDTWAHSAFSGSSKSTLR